jgi:predicted phosphodiesterase
MKRFLAFGDNHGDMVDESALDALCRFKKHYKPHLTIHLGDLFDYRALRKGISHTESDAYDGLRADTLKGYELLEKTKPNVLLLGNHDYRIYRVAAEHPSGIVREAAENGIAGIEKACKRVKCQIIPYHVMKGVYNVGTLNFLHGYSANLRAVAEHANHYGNGPDSSVVMGHLHRVEQSTGKRHGRAHGYSAGCLCDFEQMTYASHRMATSMWQVGWAFGVYDEKNHHVWLATKTGDKWMLPTGVEEL